jgi:hypothetical protein
VLDCNDMRTRKLVAVADEERSAQTWLFDFSPLHHWLWWLALAVLLVNDNLLKGRGLAPGWLTGKLSDVAFLVVAPVLLTTLLPLRLRGRRCVAFAAVVAVYAAADLSASASDAIVALAARLGLHWRLWPDLTDLLALAVLPASWWIAGTRGRRPLRPARTVVQAAGLAIGVFACLATSEDLGYPHYPFFVNRTAGPRDISLTWLLRKTDCSVDVASLAASLTSSDLDDAHALTLASGQVAPLDAVPTSSSTMAGVCGNLTSRNQSQGSCMAVVVSVKDGPAVLVSAKRYWHEGGGQIVAHCGGSDGSPSQCAPLMAIGKNPGPDALSLVETAGQWKFQAGSNLTTAPIDMTELASRVPASPGCRDLRSQIHTWLDGATACTTDADCQVLRVNLAIPGGGICIADVNRSVSSEQIAQQKAAWVAACETDDRFTCYGLEHPPLCNAGKCSELCAGLAVPSCPPTCASLGYAISLPCSAGMTCLSSDEQLCTCSETGPTSNTYALTCKQQAEVPGCPLRCIPTPAVVDAASAVEVAPDSQIDSRPSDAGVNGPLDAID